VQSTQKDASCPNNVSPVFNNTGDELNQTTVKASLTHFEIIFNKLKELKSVAIKRK
jgi:hypothetical protein